MQSLDTLEYQFDGRLHIHRTQHLHNLMVNLVDGEGCIHRTHTVLHLLLRLLQLTLTSQVGIVNQLPHAALLYQRHRGTESTELLQTCHVDAVVVGVANLRRTGYHHNLLGMQTVQDLEDTLF